MQRRLITSGTEPTIRLIAARIRNRMFDLLESICISRAFDFGYLWISKFTRHLSCDPFCSFYRWKNCAMRLGVIYVLSISPAWAADVVTVELLEAIQNRGKVGSPDMTKLFVSADQRRSVTSAQSQWPLITFLLGEAHWVHGDIDKARNEYQNLLDWSLSDPYDDGTVGSSLAGIALWRLLQENLDEIAEDEDYASKLLDAASILLGEGSLVKEFFEDSNFHVSLARFEEDIVLRLMILAWKSGDKKRAVDLFIDSFDFRTNVDLGKTEYEIDEYIIEKKLIEPECIALLQGGQLFDLKYFDEARYPIEYARKSGNKQIRAEAGLYLAKIKRNMEKLDKSLRTKIVAILDSVIEDAYDVYKSRSLPPSPCGTEITQPIDLLIQRALFERAIRHNREGGG